jgi:hypothetical protein
MESIFSDSGVANINARIDQLSPDSQALWGKMNVSQMLAHCQPTLTVGLGVHQLGKYNFFVRLIGRMVKNQMVKNEQPFKKNQPTDKTFVVADARDFILEKEKLKDAVQQFSAAGRAGKLQGVHPFFGKLSQSEWDKLQWKHLDHHLRQFGV